MTSAVLDAPAPGSTGGPPPDAPMPRVSLRRVWLIARRDYFGYIKTWGFWISFLLPVIFATLGVVAATSGFSLSSARYETVIDETGAGVGEAMLADYREGLAEAREFVSNEMPEAVRESMNDRMDEEDARLVFVPPPADTIDELQPWLRGERLIEHKGESVRLSGALQIYEEDGRARARYWTETVNNRTVPGIARRYFRKRARADYLATGGLTLEGLGEASDIGAVETFDPGKPVTDAEDGQAVTLTDRLPYFAAAGAAFFLWFTVFSGAYMLLTSMLEEKLGKLLEMTLATAQFAEIMMGKLLGIALLTLTAMAPYLLLGALGLLAVMVGGPPDVADGLRAAISVKMMVFFPVFLLLGYIFYGSLFIALGSLSESMQDAQTITVPVLIVLTACVLVVPMGLSDPNAPAVVFASWFPLSAPFAAIVRLPADPSWNVLLAITGIMVASTLAVAWLATRVFRHGVLSGAGLKGVGAWVRRSVLRQADA